MQMFLKQDIKNIKENLIISQVKCLLKEVRQALAGVAQWTECQPANQRVASSIPSQGTCLGGGHV